jgi:hypothetical protein
MPDYNLAGVSGREVILHFRECSLGVISMTSGLLGWQAGTAANIYTRMVVCFVCIVFSGMVWEIISVKMDSRV